MADETKMKDRHRRVAVGIKVNLQYPDKETFVERFSQNLSRSGIFIRAKDPAPIGSRINFEYRLSDNSRVMRGVGIVRWVRNDPADPESPPGMGIEFVDLDAETEALIDRIVARFGEGKRAPQSSKSAKPQATVTAPVARASPVLKPEEESALDELLETLDGKPLADPMVGITHELARSIALEGMDQEVDGESTPPAIERAPFIATRPASPAAPSADDDGFDVEVDVGVEEAPAAASLAAAPTLEAATQDLAPPDEDLGGLELGSDLEVGAPDASQGEIGGDSTDLAEADGSGIELGETDGTGIELGETDGTSIELGETDGTGFELGETDETGFELGQTDGTGLELGETDEPDVASGALGAAADMGDSDATGLELGLPDEALAPHADLRPPIDPPSFDFEPPIAPPALEKDVPPKAPSAALTALTLDLAGAQLIARARRAASHETLAAPMKVGEHDLSDVVSWLAGGWPSPRATLVARRLGLSIAAHEGAPAVLLEREPHTAATMLTAAARALVAPLGPLPKVKVVVPSTVGGSARRIVTEALRAAGIQESEIVTSAPLLAPKSLADFERALIIELSRMEARVTVVEGSGNPLAHKSILDASTFEVDRLATELATLTLLRQHGIDVADDPSLRDDALTQVVAARRGGATTWSITIAGAKIELDEKALTEAFAGPTERLVLACDAACTESETDPSELAACILALDDKGWPGLETAFAELFGVAPQVTHEAARARLERLG